VIRSAAGDGALRWVQEQLSEQRAVILTETPLGGIIIIEHEQDRSERRVRRE
jgi:hypothetical protein